MAQISSSSQSNSSISPHELGENLSNQSFNEGYVEEMQAQYFFQADD